MEQADIAFNKIQHHKKICMEFKTAAENSRSIDKEDFKKIREISQLSMDAKSSPQHSLAANQSHIQIFTQSGHSHFENEQSRIGDRSWGGSRGTSQIGQQLPKSQLQHEQVYNQYAYLSTAEQIHRLQQDNNQLSTRIIELERELNQLNKLHEMQEQQEWKDGLPYYILSLSNLGAFCTRLSISKHDYEKIEYQNYSIKLDLDKLTLTPATLARNANGYSKAKQSTSFKKKILTLKLGDLKSVQYPLSPCDRQVDTKLYSSSFSHIDKIKEEGDEYVIIYYFQEKNSKRGEISSRTLFLRFQNEQEMDEWDLGIYINYQIMENLKNNTQNSWKKRRQSSLASFKEKQLIACEEMSPMFKVKHSSKTKGLNLQECKKQENSSHNYEDSGQSSQSLFESRGQEQDIQMGGDHQEEAEMQRQQIQRQEQQIHKKKEEELERERLKQEQSQRKLAEQMANKQQEARLKRQQENKRKIEQEKNREKTRIVQKQIAISKAKSALKRGYILTKYAKGAISPYQKRVMINSDEDKLCWRDKNSVELRHVNIKDIQEVRKGQTGPGIQKHLSADQLKWKHCFVVIEICSANRKSLQFGAKDHNIMNSFCNDLMLCLSQKSVNEQQREIDIKF